MNNILVDAQELPRMVIFYVIHTPKYSANHISIYIKQSKTLITGDSIYSING